MARISSFDWDGHKYTVADEATHWHMNGDQWFDFTPGAVSHGYDVYMSKVGAG